MLPSLRRTAAFARTTLSPRSTSTMTRTGGGWKAGDEIKFDPATTTTDHRRRVGREWSPGQAIEFAPRPPLGEQRANDSRDDSRLSCRATASSTTTTTTFDLSSSRSWDPNSNRWSPASASRSSSSSSFESDASRPIGRREGSTVFSLSPLMNDARIKPTPPSPARPPVVLSRAELDRLVDGIDFEHDDDFDHDIDYDDDVARPSTSTPPRTTATTTPSMMTRQSNAETLTRQQVQELCSGIDFSDMSWGSDREDVGRVRSPFEEEIEAEEDATESSFHSAMSTAATERGFEGQTNLFPNDRVCESTSGASRRDDVGRSEREPVRAPRVARASSPRIIVLSSSGTDGSDEDEQVLRLGLGLGPARTRPRPRPRVPSRPDVFTLSSTPPPPPPLRPLPRVTSRSLMTLPPSTRESDTSRRDRPCVEVRNDDDDFSSSVEIVTEARRTISPRIVRQEPGQATTTIAAGLNKTARARGRHDKENDDDLSVNEPSRPPPPTKPGYFTRPPNLKPLAVDIPVRRNATETARRPLVGRSSLSSTSRRATIADDDPSPPLPARRPRREQFRGRNGDGRYRSALKQYELRQKWPVEFDYETFTTTTIKSSPPPPPRVVFTTDEKVVETTLNGMSGPLGFDLEWNAFELETKSPGRTALVQVCDGDTILLVQVAKMTRFPKSLQALIEDPLRIKLGVQIAGDGKKLERDFGFSPQGLLELNDLTKRFDRERHVELARGPLIGLQDLVAEYLDRYLAKDDDVRCGVWSRSLSKRQIRYGANDVYSSLQVLFALERKVMAGVDLYEFTKPKQTTTSRTAVVAASSSSSSRKGDDSRFGGRRKREAYELFQLEGLDLDEVAVRMSESNRIQPTSVLWNLLGAYNRPNRLEWDEARLDEAVKSVEMKGRFVGKIEAEHGETVRRLRSRKK